MEFGDKLKLLIKSKYGRLGDLADKFEMNYTQLSQYVNGKKISIEFLAKIIREFPEADLNWLLRGDAKLHDTVQENQGRYKKILTKEQILEEMELLLKDLKCQLEEKQ